MTSYEFNHVEELHGEEFHEWVRDVVEYRYLGYSVLETCKEFDIAPHVVKQLEDIDDNA